MANKNNKYYTGNLPKNADDLYGQWWDDYGNIGDQKPDSLQDDWKNGDWNTAVGLIDYLKRNRNMNFSDFAKSNPGLFLLSRGNIRKDIYNGFNVSDNVKDLVEKNDFSGAAKLAEQEIAEPKPEVQPENPAEEPRMQDENTDEIKVAPEAVAAEQMEKAEETEKPRTIPSTDVPKGTAEIDQEEAKKNKDFDPNYKKGQDKLNEALNSPGVWDKIKSGIKTGWNATKDFAGKVEKWAEKEDPKTHLSFNDFLRAQEQGLYGVNIAKYMNAGFNHQPLPAYDNTQYQKAIAELADDYYKGISRRSQEVKDAANKPKADLAANKQRVANLFESWGMSDRGITALANHLDDEELSYESFLDTLEVQDPAFIEGIMAQILDQTKNDKTVTIDDEVYNIDGLMKATAEMSDSDPKKKRNMDVIKALQESINEDAMKYRDTLYKQFYNDYQSARQQSQQSLDRETARRNIEGQDLSNTYKNLENQAKQISNVKDQQDFIQGVTNNINELRKLKFENTRAHAVENYYETERQLMSIVDGVYTYSKGNNAGFTAELGFKGVASIGGSVGTASNTTIDALRKANIPIAVDAAQKEYNLEAPQIEAWNKFIDEQIKYLSDILTNAKRAYASGRTSMLPGRRTSVQDYQGAMGYDGYSPINKDSSYYLGKMKGNGGVENG